MRLLAILGLAGAALAMTGCTSSDPITDLPDAGTDADIPSDAGDDASPDGGQDAGPVGPEIVYSMRLAVGEMVLEGDELQDVDIDPLTLQSDGSEYLFILNVPETWTTTGSLGAQYCIDVDDETLACAHFQSGHAGQRIPITVVGAKNLAAGSHTVKAQWGCFGCSAAQQLRIGTHHASWLVAMRAEGAQYATRPIGGDVLTRSDAIWTEIDLSPPSLSIDSDGGDYLFVLSVPQTWSSGGTPEFRILLDEEPVAGGVYSTASSLADQRVPITVIGAATLAAGTHSVGAEVQGPGSPSTVNLGSSTPTWLIALPAPETLVHATRPTTQEAVLDGVTADIDIDPPLFVSSGGDHLFILNAPQTWMQTSGWENFYLFVDDEGLAGGVHSGEQNQRVPTTIVGVKSLEAGMHSFKGVWKTEPSMTARQGKDYPTLLLGL